MSEEKEKYISPYQHIIDEHKRFKEALAELPPEQAACLKDHDPYDRITRGLPYIKKVTTEPSTPEAGVPFKLTVEGENFDKEMELQLLGSEPPRVVDGDDFADEWELLTDFHKRGIRIPPHYCGRVDKSKVQLLSQKEIVAEVCANHPGHYIAIIGKYPFDDPRNACSLSFIVYPRSGAAPEKKDTETPTLVVGVNKTTREITFGKASKTLNEARSKLLDRLNQDKNRTVSKDNLLLFTWGDNPPYESQLYTEIKQLRKVFRAMKIPAKIGTVHKVGYKLVPKKDVIFDIE